MIAFFDVILITLVGCLMWRNASATERQRAKRMPKPAAPEPEPEPEPELSDWRRFKRNLRQRYGQ